MPPKTNVCACIPPGVFHPWLNKISSMKRPFLPTLAFASIALLCACSKKTVEPENAPAPTHSLSADSHAHAAPHGGTLLELGNHHLILEFVHDPAAGKLTAYLLDAHAENFIRTPLAAIDILVARNGPPFPLTLHAVENPATGETIGNSAEFAVEADALKGAAPLNLTIPIIIIRDRTFTNLSVTVNAPGPTEPKK